MSFNIEYSHSLAGIVTVKVPTVALDGKTTVIEAPFKLQIQVGGNNSFEVISGNNWTAQPYGDFTVYTRNAPLNENQTFELYPLTNTSTSEFYFPPTGFNNPPSATPYPYSVNVPQGWDNTAPTLGANGIREVQFNADNTPLSNNGRESAYTVSFSERVNLPLMQGHSIFGGAPPSSTITLTPMSSATTSGVLLADLWHVKVTTPNANDPVNLTLTPKLQVTNYETNVSLPPTGTTVFGENSNQQIYWAKVTLDGDLYEGRVFDSAPLNVTMMGPNDTGTINVSTIKVATSSSETNVLYLGFSSAPPQQQSGYEVKLYENSSFASPLGGQIMDSSNNLMELTLTSPMEPFVSVLTDGTIGTFVSEGTRNGFEVLDMRALSQGPLIVEADYGFMTVYDANGNARRIEIDFYDKYILNDRVSGKVGNTFYGTDDSEYVVVGNGGDNFLRAGNQGSGSMAPETDIVDYSKVIGSGITVDLGNSVSKDVSVTYTDNRSFDVIRGFEGVVGSGGMDTISGSNAANYLSGGAGNDTLRGYSLNNQGEFSSVTGDLMYNQVYLDKLYGAEVSRAPAQWEKFKYDSRDVLMGGAGMDTIYGGAGGDFLADLDAAVMWGSDMVTSGALRDNNDSDLAEYDTFMVRGSPTETATIENFHLSKNGTGLAGRSYSAHDSIVFSVDSNTLVTDAYLNISKGGSQELGEGLFGSFLNDVTYELEAGMGDDLYRYIWDNLTFTQTQVGTTKDMKLTATFSDKFGSLSEYSAVVGEVIIADLVTSLGVKNSQGRFANQADVVELDWFADILANRPEILNPKLDLDMINMDRDLTKWSFDDMEIAFAMELLQAGTVREANDYDVMASNLADMSLDERIFNPDEDDNTILGSAGKDIYEFITQDFDVTKTDKDFDAGNDTIFDIGGNNDILAFSEAKIDELTFSAVQVGRESGRSSLRVEYEQTLNPGNPTNDIRNSGEITWQGHFREGGRQAAEFVEVSNGSGSVDKYAMAKTEYEYDMKGYVIAGSEKLVANDTFNAIMVGRTDGDDEFVFNKEVVAGSTPLIQQKATIAGFSAGDKIDISKYGTVLDADILISPNADSPEESNARLTFNSGFVLNLSFQDAMVDLDDLKFALYGTP